MSALIDTSVLIDAERRRDAAGSIPSDVDVSIAAITATELLVGVLRGSGRKKNARSTYVERVLATVPILVYDLRVARAHAELRAWVLDHGSPRSAHDLMIAATALAHGLEIITRDARAFKDLPGVRLLEN